MRIDNSSYIQASRCQYNFLYQCDKEKPVKQKERLYLKLPLINYSYSSGKMREFIGLMLTMHKYL